MPAVTPPFQGLIFGAGAPAIVKPAGILYSRTDAAGVYQSVINPNQPRVAKFAHNDGNGTVTMPTLSGAPTAGNLLLACIPSGWGQQGSLINGWGFVNGNSGAVAPPILLYRYAQAGDTATPPPPFTANIGQHACELLEIDGGAGGGFIPTNPAQAILASTNDANTSTFNTSAINATTAAQLLVYFGMGYGWTANSPYPAGLTGVEQFSNSPNYGGITTATLNTVGAGNVGGNQCVREPGSLGNNFAFQAIIVGQAQSWTLIGP